MSAARRTSSILSTNSLTSCPEVGTENASDENSFDSSLFKRNIPQDEQWSDLLDVQYLTSGGSSWIYTATWNDLPVIVKSITPGSSNEEIVLQKMEGEMEILMKLDHPNIIKLLGAGFTPKGRRFLILERLDGGTLAQICEDKVQNKPRAGLFSKNNRNLPLKNILLYAVDIASALAYCHSGEAGGRILHRDLKPDNIGFTDDGTLRIMDFGLACEVEQVSPDEENKVYSMSGGTGSLRYMAPEVALCSDYNQKVDVYSFGVILWEMLSSSKPFAGLTASAFYEKVVRLNHRPPINKKWLPKLTQIMQQCWDIDVHKRPSFQEIHLELESLYIEKFGDTRGGKVTNMLNSSRRSSYSAKPLFNREKNPARRRLSALA